MSPSRFVLPGTLLMALLSGACASTGAVPKPFPLYGGASTTVEPPSGSGGGHVDGATITSVALSLRGAPYRDGGTDPSSGFDCSGFTQYVFARSGVALPREVRDQYRMGETVAPEKVVAGDLLFFTTTAPGPTHVAIALGGDQFIHAPSSTGVVRVERLSTSYWTRRFLAARRIN